MKTSPLKWLFARLSLLLLLAISPLAAQQPVGLPEDWSHRHLIFSYPGTAQQAQRDGKLEKWAAVISDFRYQHQVTRRNLKPAVPPAATLVAAEPAGGDNDEEAGPAAEERDGQSRTTLPARRRHHAAKPHGDWSYFLGATAGASVAQNNFPAKYTFDVNAYPACVNDFATFAINKAGSSTQPSIIAFNNLYSGPALAASGMGTFTAQPSNGQTVTITNGASSVVLTASSSLNTGTNFQTSATLATDAANLAAAISRNGSGVGVGAVQRGRWSR